MANQTRVSKVDLVDTLSHSPETTRRTSVVQRITIIKFKLSFFC